MKKIDTSPNTLRDWAGVMLYEDHQKLADILEALADGKEAQGWRPIETAPKDGTSVLLVNQRGNMASGLWMEGILGTGWFLRGGSGGPNVFFNGHHNPTHWMPLPEGPTDKEAL